ncbi:MAG: hypothetical protein IPO27_11210 [Bacteroidetes bacterium]|nr:hypothetical protein [Bacteroidota bacterium]
MHAQQGSNYREQTVFFKKDTMVLDTVSIIPGSIRFYNCTNALIDSNAYRIDFAKAKLILINRNTITNNYSCDSAKISYRVFPLLFTQSFYNRKLLPKNPDSLRIFDNYEYIPSTFSDDFFTSGGISKSGSISRGISFGNNQDVVVNSSLSLQLAGKLNKQWEVAAAITDNNIPIQPEGNTQQLQDFDRVYIQLKNNNTRILAGDFDLLRPSAYFLSYLKRAQGIQIENQNNIAADDTIKNRVAASASISRGKYARIVVKPIEGNQGPYRMTGAQNELSIIILAGTERVYIDGQLQTRGAQSDYIIDYNTAEITFTPRRLINTFMRIVVEFQYSDKNYVRTMLAVNDEWRYKKWKLNFNFYNEQDSKNQPLLQELDDSSKIILANAGNNPLLAVIPTIDSVGYNTNEVLYAKIDTIVNGIQYSDVLLYAISSDSALYRAVFSFVGEGNGNYIQLLSAANGKVFKWVAPLNGLRQGSYEPVSQLIAPKRGRQLTAGASYDMRNQGYIRWEGSMTNTDANLFSSIDNQANTGYGSMLSTLQQFKLDSGANPLTMVLRADWEFITQRFRAVEVYRPQEFANDWNIAADSRKTDEHIVSGLVGIKKSNSKFLNYTYKTFLRDSLYTGAQHGISAAYSIHHFTLTTNTNLLNTTATDFNSEFTRSYNQLTKQIKKIETGLLFNYEKNAIANRQLDSMLQVPGRNYIDRGVFIKTIGDNNAINFNAKYNYRTDDEVIKNKLQPYATAHNGEAAFAYRKKKYRIGIQSGVRIFELLQDTTPARKEQSIVNRIDGSVIALKGFITLNATYQNGTGREMRKEYVFLEVAPGLGVYTWNDYNSNGVKELNEFEISQFVDKANYVKVLLPTNNYIRAFSNAATAVISLMPSNLFQSSRQNIFQKFQNQFAWKADNKTTDSDWRKSYNPLAENVRDSNLIAANTSLRNTLSFNRSSAVWDVEYVYVDSRTKSILANGYEFRTRNGNTVTSRLTIARTWTLLIRGEHEKSNNESEFFKSRNYSLYTQRIFPTLTYQPTPAVSIAASYNYAQKNNRTENKESAMNSDAGIQLRLSGWRKINLTLFYNYINIKYRGDPNSPVAYEMLEALQPGNNSRWGLNLLQNVSKTLQIGINYEGRKSETSNAVHVANMQARAFF